MIRNVVTVCDGASLTGGTEKVAITTAIELQRRGYRSLFFAGEGELDPILAANRVEGYSMGLTDAYNTSSKIELLGRFVWHKAAGDKFAEFLSGHKLNPSETIIHVHGFRRILSGSVIEAASELGYRQIFTLHDYGLACPNTSFYNFPKQEICKLKPLSTACFCSQCTHSGWPMKLMQMARGVKLQMNKVADYFSHFVYVSEFSKSILEPYVPSDAPATVLYNPASDEKPAIAEPSQSDVFTFVGRLSPEKGGTLFAEAARAAGVKARFVGKGPQEAEIKALNPQAEMTGWVSTDQVAEYIRTSRAVVMPSLWYETAGLSVIDAVSMGIPVIVSDKCASTEYFQHERSGLAFKTGRVKALTEALQAMTPERAKVMGINAYTDYWQRPLTTEKYMNGLLEIYNSMLSS